MDFLKLAADRYSMRKFTNTHLEQDIIELGIGSTWVMHFDPAAMREEFAIPKNIEPVALLIMGHPAPDATPMDLHSSFRPLEEVVCYDSF